MKKWNKPIIRTLNVSDTANEIQYFTHGFDFKHYHHHEYKTDFDHHCYITES